MELREKVVREYWPSERHVYCGLVYLIARARGGPLPLTTIMNRRGCDKGTVHGSRNGLFAGHAYTKVYKGLFAHRRDDPARLLEVGIGPVESRVTRTALLPQFDRTPLHRNERHPGTLAILRKRQ